MSTELIFHKEENGDASNFAECIYFINVLMDCSFMAQAGQESQPKSLTLEEIERLQQIDKTISMLDQIQKKSEEVDAKFRVQCLRARVNENFCTCLLKNRPWVLDFVGYRNIVTSTKEELNYTKLNKEEKGVVDNTYAAREICAKGNLWK